MNLLEKTFRDMLKSSIAYLRNNESAWSNNPVITDDLEALEDTNVEIDKAVKAQNDSDTSGYVAQKKQEIQTLGKAIYRIDRDLTHLAKKTNNQVLLKSADLSESALTVGETNEIMLRYSLILSLARTYLTELAVYKVTSEILDDLDAQLKTLSALPEEISTITNNHKSATRSIKELKAEASTILDLLDDSIEGMLEDEKFIEGWHDARKIKGRRNYRKDDNTTATETPKTES